MRTEVSDRSGNNRGVTRAVLVAALLAGCGGGGSGGGGGDGPAIKARPQSITFGAAPILPLGETASFTATASSGLTLKYISYTSSVCTVGWTTGLVTALSPGDCTVAAVQDGDDTYVSARATQTVTVYIDPSQTFSFAAAPTLEQWDRDTVTAMASSGLAVTYTSLTPAICSVDATDGRMEALEGSCTIVAHQAGSATYPIYNPANGTQTFVVAPPAAPAIPGRPTKVSATLGATIGQVIVKVGATKAGGTPITGYTVTSSPAGVTATDAAPTIAVTCPGSCVGYAFTVHATNAVGDGTESDPVDVITAYNVVETFREPATQPNDTIFTGSFRFNSTDRTVSDLKGHLTQSMTGGCATIAGCPGSYGSVPMTTVYAQNQLVSQAVTLGGVDGLLVTTFVLNTTNTFFDGLGGDGWSPQHGVDVGGIYFGWPTAPNPYNGGVGNSSAMIFVNTADPTVPLAQAQINMLAYADCSVGGMMGAVCMTGTSIAGYGAVGTMGGFPFSQVITRY